MSNASVESPPSTPTGENAAVKIPAKISTPHVDLEMYAPYEGSTPHVRMRGVSVRQRCGSKDAISKAGSSNSSRLRTINGKINAMDIHAPASPIGITPEDCRIHAQRPEPIVLQEPMLEQLMLGKMDISAQSTNPNTTLQEVKTVQSVHKLMSNSIGDDLEALAFEEDDPDALAFETNDKEGLAYEANDPQALFFLPLGLENMYSSMSSSVKSLYHFSKCLDGPLLDTMSGELYTISS
ncbi:hypothetical protein Tco_0480721 [Tanacetum coccineum]